MFVDTSVWVDYFNGVDNSATALLDASLGVERIVVGDIVLAEVLSGFRSESDFRTAGDLLTRFDIRPVLGQAMAIRSARNYRLLRKRGVTVRKTIDVIIATYCIEQKLPLLHRDRDFEPFSRHLGLKTVLA